MSHPQPARARLDDARMNPRSSWFQRLILPGFAFKAVVIGGGYATGRELATFFLPSGPRGGLLAIALATLIWSLVVSITFVYAFDTRSRDYRTFFRSLLGPFWMVFEAAWLMALVLILAVYAAAAGAIAHALSGAPDIVGALALMVGITLVVTWGNRSVEALFKWVSVLLYGTYALFLTLALVRFGDRSLAALSSPVPAEGWLIGGATYAGYNLLGAVLILPALRHLRTRRDALVSGLLAGPLAMLPALCFFFCMVAFYPDIGSEPLPSDFLLAKIGLPAFRVIFQTMIFAALLESGAGGMHAINERVANAFESYATKRPRSGRFVLTAAILCTSVFLAGRFGLVALIARGYVWLSWGFLLVYVLPMVTVGLARVIRATQLTPRPEGMQQ
jgi:uncharacterized membrane protein YkvI